MLEKTHYDKFLQILPDTLCSQLKTALRERGKHVELDRGDILINENPQNPKIYYLIKGSCIRYIVTPEGDERAIIFHTEDFLPVIGNMYVNSENSWVQYIVKANEHTELIELNSSFGFEWQKKDPAFSLFIYQKSVEYLSIVNQLQNHLIGLKSEMFFEWVLKKHPFIVQRFLSKDIASFMGVTPVWLSNIKRKLQRK